jgi:starch synthase
MMILMVAAEFSPYVESGPSALVVAQLGRALVQLGHEVSVMLPKFPGFEDGGLLVARRLSPLELPGGGAATIFDGQLGSGVKLILVDGPQYFERGVYGDGPDRDHPERDYSDNAERFGFFAEAVSAFVRERQQQGNPFDVVHCYDWPGALTVLQLKRLANPPPCLFSFQDTKRQGSFDKSVAQGLRLPAELVQGEAMQLADRLSVLKGGLTQADAITVAAPSLLAELSDESRHGVLAVTMARRAPVSIGIQPGLDYAVYNPATDPELVSRFDAQHLDAKGNCRTAVVRELGLELDDHRPLVVMFTAPSASGIPSKADVQQLCGRLLQNELNLVVAGKGVADLGAVPESLQRSCAFVDAPSGSAERRLCAAADFALLLNDDPQDVLPIRKAQRYAAVPIAKAAGAALDAVVDCDAQLETGTGFLFASSSEIVGTVQRALAAYREPSWPRLQRRVASLDLGWDRVAHRYQKLYRQLQK